MSCIVSPAHVHPLNPETLFHWSGPYSSIRAHLHCQHGSLYGINCADKVEAGRRLGLRNDQEGIAPDIPTRLAYLERLPTVAEQLIFPPIGWIDYKIGKLGDIGAATRDVLANVARWFWNIR